MEKASAIDTKLDATASFNLPKPLTLSHKELSTLREAALEEINTHTKEEAAKIFGLKPVVVTQEFLLGRALGKCSGNKVAAESMLQRDQSMFGNDLIVT